MKQRIVIAVVATILLGSAPLLTSVGAQATIAPIAAACSPTTSTIGGKSAVTYCGPATATLVTGGKTYKFTKGECVSIKVSDITVDLTLGTLVQGKNDTVLKGNANKPYLSLGNFGRRSRHTWVKFHAAKPTSPIMSAMTSSSRSN
jgi:hypothetical protein